MPRRSQARPNDSPKRSCDSSHVPTTHAHDIGMCPRKVAHEPRIHVVTCAHDSPMCVYEHTPHGHGHQTRRQAPTPPRQPMCTGTCTWHGGQPTRRAHRRPRPSDGRPCQTRHGAHGHARASLHPYAPHPEAPRSFQKNREGARHFARRAPSAREEGHPRARAEGSGRPARAPDNPRCFQKAPDTPLCVLLRPCSV